VCVCLKGRGSSIGGVADGRGISGVTEGAAGFAKASNL
jgi:hypothetical protein